MITISFGWKEMDADYSICFLCEDLIRDQMFQACVTLEGKDHLINTKICGNCKKEVDKENGKRINDNIPG